MNFPQIINHRLLIFLSMMILGNLGTSSVLANELPIISMEEVEALETPTGDSQDLRVLEAKDNPQWPWEVGDKSETNGNNVEYTIDINSLENSPSVNLEKEDKNWQNLHRGDPKKSGGRVPLADF